MALQKSRLEASAPGKRKAKVGIKAPLLPKKSPGGGISSAGRGLRPRREMHPLRRVFWGLCPCYDVLRKEELLEKPPSSPYRLRKKTKGTSSSNAPGTSPVEHPPPLEERGNVVKAGVAVG